MLTKQNLYLSFNFYKLFLYIKKKIDEINEIFRTDIPQGDDYASLNGLLHEKLRDIPKEGDKIIIGKLRIIVEKVLSNKPEKIRIEKVVI